MRRRSFVKTMGAGLSLGFTNFQLPFPAYNPYQEKIKSVTDAESKEGLLMVRFSFQGNQEDINLIKSKININKAKINKSRTYWFEPKDQADEAKRSISLQTYSSDQDILVLWLEQATSDTRIKIDGFDNSSFLIQEILDNPELVFENSLVKMTTNLLFDKEIGEIQLPDYGIEIPGNKFRFNIFADPQGGNPTAENTESPTRMKIHNAFIEESIAVTNELDPQPAFNIVLGDFVDSKGQKEHFTQMVKYFRKLKTPYLLEVGNHETAYSADFTPGYDMSALNNFFSAQKAVNGMQHLLYSFNAGKWHFIIWPDPLRSSFWPAHPHYFEWLERDLEKYKDKPTIFLQHIPVHPIGINPLINYVESVEVKRKILDTLATHGNVRFIFSGHVHIPIKASLKTAVTYKGMKLINLPAAGYRPRAFGEEDYFGGPSQGITVIDIDEDQVAVKFKTVTRREFHYPGSFPEFETERYALWLKNTWELPAGNQLKNGDFTHGMRNWFPRFVYREDENPSNICEIRQGKGKNESPALYMYSRPRGYKVPGQDRLPQEINRICQLVKTVNGRFPYLKFTFKIDESCYHPEALSSPYLWIEGFSGPLKKLNMLYSTGMMHHNIGGRYAQNRVVSAKNFHMPFINRKWNEAFINIPLDFQSFDTYKAANIDALAINLGVWTINDGHQQESGIYVDQLDLQWTDQANSQPSGINDDKIIPKKEEQFWRWNMDHISGEHHFFMQDILYPDIT